MIETESRTMHPLNDIDYWLPEQPGRPYAHPFRLRKYHEPVEVVSGPFALIPGEGHWGNSGAGSAFLVRTHHGHEIVVNADLLSDEPLCHWCGEPSADMNTDHKCGVCRQSDLLP